MDTRTALLFLVIFAAFLVAGILFFLFRAIRVLERIESSTREIESVTIPLLQSLRRMAEEIEPVIQRTTEHYRTIEEGIGSLTRNPLLSLLSPIFKMGEGPIHAVTSLFKIARGLAAGFSRAREVLKESRPPLNPASPSPNIQEEHHGQ
ncbi:MAG: hypothetical protein M0Z25_08300 [Nitrospiraceae bacterium]|nr:hypothetical protein [Nitrospiraceae bacterium]